MSLLSFGDVYSAGVDFLLASAALLCQMLATQSCYINKQTAESVITSLDTCLPDVMREHAFILSELDFRPVNYLVSTC